MSADWEPDKGISTPPDWVRWLAQDSNGKWWGYSVEPLRNDFGWYENEVGDYVLLGQADPAAWQDSLQRFEPGARLPGSRSGDQSKYQSGDRR